MCCNTCFLVFNFFLLSVLTSLSLSDLHERFRHESLILKNISKQTERFYYYGLHTLLKFRKYDHVSQIDESELISYFFWGREQRKWSPHTMSVRYKSLNTFFKWCILKNVIQQNPLENIPKPRLPQLKPKSLSKSDATKIYEYVQLLPLPKHYKNPMYEKRLDTAIIATYLFTGLRLNELRGLRLEHVNLEEKLITVIEGKGMKDRIVPIPFELLRVLKQFIFEREKTGIICSYFFTSQKYQQQISEKKIKSLVKKIKDGTGVNFSVHKLRHTFATLMIESKCDLYSLSKMLGHSDVKTTQVYLSASGEHLKKQADLHPLNYMY